MQANEGPMAAVFAAPGKYIQGRGAVGRLGEVLEQLGSGKPLLLCDPIVEELMGGTLEGLRGATRVEFGGECSPQEIDREPAAAPAAGADAVVAMGAGRRWTRRSPSPTRLSSRSS